MKALTGPSAKPVMNSRMKLSVALLCCALGCAFFLCHPKAQTRESGKTYWAALSGRGVDEGKNVSAGSSSGLGSHANLSEAEPPFQKRAKVPFLALHTASVKGRPKLVRQLLAAGADIEERGGPENSTPLHEAAVHGRTDLVRLLLEHRADVSAKDARQKTALHLAVSWGLAKVLPPFAPSLTPLFFSATRHIDAVTLDGFTAMDWAERNGHVAGGGDTARARGGCCGQGHRWRDAAARGGISRPRSFGTHPEPQPSTLNPREGGGWRERQISERQGRIKGGGRRGGTQNPKL